MEDKSTSIKSWAEDDRPREKMASHGAASLSKAELLAILIGSGTPGVSAVQLMRNVLSDYGDSLRLLGKASVKDLMRYKGLGEAKAITILAACQLANRRMTEEWQETQKIESSIDIFHYFQPLMQDLTVEECRLLLMNHSMHVQGSVLLGRGGLTGTYVDVRELLRHTLLSQSTIIALCHNHPSGTLRPSREDDKLTESVMSACKIMNISFVDHVILGNGNYYSYRDEGKL